MDRIDLFHGHIGGIDTLARSLLVAEALIKNGGLASVAEARYREWETGLGRDIETGMTLTELAARVQAEGIDPAPISGGQEHLENVVNQTIWTTR
jgi:xylose isomerase